MTITFAAPREVLVTSSIPGANEALAAGHAARDAQMRAEHMTTERDRREARSLPEGGRERGWALVNRARYAAETEEASHKAESASDLTGSDRTDARNDAREAAFQALGDLL